MIMAIPPYLGLSVSVLNNNQTAYSMPEKEVIETRVADIKKTSSSIDGSLTLMPKKRSFDVAFLISPDDNKSAKSKKQDISKKAFEAEPQTDFVVQSCENETIKSAFKKVGIGFVPSPLGESRSPSPIDAIRTPSPYSKPKGTVLPEMMKQPLQQQLQQQLQQKKESFQHYANVVVSSRPRFQNYHKELDKSAIFLGNNLINPVSVGGLARQNFIPAPIFGGNPILPASFVNAASLLPPSLAALTLPAQNVCAKCNVSFRMTSDLVYHMRSHHKNDHASADHLRRRREMDKLKCPVCNESFRERHHLTRHMTAHQDKEGDNIDGDINIRGTKGKPIENSKLCREYDQ